MEELENNLNAILVEKNTKIIPENIKSGVTIFGVKGTAATQVDIDYKSNLYITQRILNGTVSSPYVEDDMIYWFSLNNTSEEYKSNTSVSNNGILFEIDNDISSYVAKCGSRSITFDASDINKSNLTISILAKSTGNTSAHNFMITVCGDEVPNSSLSLCACNGKLSIDVCFTTYNTEFDINDNNWHRYTVTLENGNTIKVYVDTELVLEKTHQLTLGNNGMIGNWYHEDLFFNGYLSDALIYNRVLTEDEISTNYNQSNIPLEEEVE